MFKDHQLAAFSQPITSLPDSPNLLAQALKERFDACPQELRETYNGLCAALDDIGAARQLGFQRTAGVPADTIQSAIESVQTQVADAVMGVIPSGSVTGDKLAADVQSRLSAIETAAQNEAAIRQQTDSAETVARQQADAAESSARQQADNNLQGQINTHTTQIAAKCEVVLGTFQGTYQGSGTVSQDIQLGFQPRAVFCAGTYDGNRKNVDTMFVFAMQGFDSVDFAITANGFTATNLMNFAAYSPYRYIAFK